MMKCDIFKIWETHRNELRGYVVNRVSDKNDVDDILQTILIKVTDYCETKNNVIHLKAWLYRVTQNAIFDFYKHSNRVKVAVEQMDLETANAYDESIFIWLHTFIKDLPEEYAKPLRLSDLEGIPQKAIARQLGLTLEATKSRIQRARKRLREKFDECGKMELEANHTLNFTVTKACCMK